jgi:hypothetical protein
LSRSLQAIAFPKGILTIIGVNMGLLLFVLIIFLILIIYAVVAESGIFPKLKKEWDQSFEDRYNKECKKTYGDKYEKD